MRLMTLEIIKKLFRKILSYFFDEGVKKSVNGCEGYSNKSMVREIF